MLVLYSADKGTENAGSLYARRRFFVGDALARVPHHQRTSVNRIARGGDERGRSKLSQETNMFKASALLSVLAATHVIAASTPANAAPIARQILSEGASAPLVQLTRATRSRGLKLSTTQSGGACGVWRCTWPTSNGGCLVWEKTRCKVINPF